jgi:hypothetical protein
MPPLPSHTQPVYKAKKAKTNILGSFYVHVAKDCKFFESNQTKHALSSSSRTPLRDYAAAASCFRSRYEYDLPHAAATPEQIDPISRTDVRSITNSMLCFLIASELSTHPRQILTARSSIFRAGDFRSQTPNFLRPLDQTICTFQPCSDTICYCRRRVVDLSRNKQSQHDDDTKIW